MSQRSTTFERRKFDTYCNKILVVGMLVIAITMIIFERWVS